MGGSGDSVWRKADTGECCQYENGCSQPPGDTPGVGNTTFFSAAACDAGQAGCNDITFCTLECCKAPNYANCLKDADGCDTCNCQEGGGSNTCNPSPDGALPTGDPGDVLTGGALGCVSCTCVDSEEGADWNCNEDSCETCVYNAANPPWKIADDSCNGCFCNEDGYYICTTNNCAPGVCAPGLPPDPACDNAQAWGLSPGGICCPYNSPCEVPLFETTGYQKFIEEFECHDAQALWGLPPSSESP
jgi:hypothetical protein